MKIRPALFFAIAAAGLGGASAAVGSDAGSPIRLAQTESIPPDHTQPDIPPPAPQIVVLPPAPAAPVTSPQPSAIASRPGNCPIDPKKQGGPRHHPCTEQPQ